MSRPLYDGLFDADSTAEFARPLQDSARDLNDCLLRLVQKRESRELTKQLHRLEEQVKSLNIQERKKSRFNWFRKNVSQKEASARLHRHEAELDRMGVRLAHLKRGFERDQEELIQLQKVSTRTADDLKNHVTALEQRISELRAGQPESLLSQAAETRKLELLTSQAVLNQTVVQVEQLIESTVRIQQKLDNAIFTIIPLWKQQIRTARDTAAASLELAEQIQEMKEMISD